MVSDVSTFTRADQNRLSHAIYVPDEVSCQLDSLHPVLLSRRIDNIAAWQSVPLR